MIASSMWFECCLRMQIMLQIIWHAALISSHHAMHCCHHSVSIARAGQTVYLQIKAEQKEIIQNVLERKDSMAECYQRASERACVTFPLFGQGTTFFFLMVNCLSCRIRLNVSSSMWFECCLRMQIMLQIIWHAALISSHYAMCCRRK
jgi:hypothetical protein